VTSTRGSPSRPRRPSRRRTGSPPTARSTATCVACHTINGHPDNANARVGPDLTHFASREIFAGVLETEREDDLRAWLRNPQEQKPGAQMPNLNLSEEQIDALVAYLYTLE
jgi:cytochrome c oxidase subunit II